MRTVRADVQIMLDQECLQAPLLLQMLGSCCFFELQVLDFEVDGLMLLKTDARTAGYSLLLAADRVVHVETALASGLAWLGMPDNTELEFASMDAGLFVSSFWER